MTDFFLLLAAFNLAFGMPKLAIACVIIAVAFL